MSQFSPPHPHSPNHHHHSQILGGSEIEVACVNDRTVGGAQEVEEESDRAVPDEEDNDVRSCLSLASRKQQKQQKQNQPIDRIVQPMIMPDAIGILDAEGKIGKRAWVIVDEKAADASDENSKWETKDGGVCVRIDVNVSSTQKPNPGRERAQESTHDREPAMPDAEKFYRILDVGARFVHGVDESRSDKRCDNYGG